MDLLPVARAALSSGGCAVSSCRCFDIGLVLMKHRVSVQPERCWRCVSKQDVLPPIVPSVLRKAVTM